MKFPTIYFCFQNINYSYEQSLQIKPSEIKCLNFENFKFLRKSWEYDYYY